MPTLTLAPGSSFVRLRASDGHFLRREYAVKVVAGPDAGAERALTTATVIGSGPEAGLRLDDATVSRAHVELTPKPFGVAVRDLGSKNGTLVGGVRVQEALIDAETDLALGRTVVRVLVSDADEGEAPAQPTFGGLIGSSPAMRRLFGLLTRAAASDATVLLAGETGTGKGEVARALHQASARARAPFVTLDCGAIAPQLIESELFGHVRGAFTGAVGERLGLATEAQGGVLFLDEVGELPLELQPRLLRLLETRAVRRVGDQRDRQLDVRVIAASHRSLREEVRAGRFREDLYFRLAVVELTVPPLRERREDTLPLALHFVGQKGLAGFTFAPSLVERFASYGWPGNVRELRNVVERVLAGVGPEPAASEEVPATFKEAKERVVDAFTREYLLALLARHDGNISAVAREAGLNRNHVAVLMEKLKLR